MSVEVSDVGGSFEVWYYAAMGPRFGTQGVRIGQGDTFDAAVLDATRELVGALCALGEIQPDE